MQINLVQMRWNGIVVDCSGDDNIEYGYFWCSEKLDVKLKKPQF